MKGKNNQIYKGLHLFEKLSDETKLLIQVTMKKLSAIENGICIFFYLLTLFDLIIKIKLL